MPSKSLRVLIVDDSVELAELLALSIQRRGHQVFVAHDVDEAMAIALRFVPNVAVLDIMIRCESGYILAERLREVATLSRCRLIAITGFDRAQHRRASEAAGFYRHLIKPLDMVELFEAIESSDPSGGLT